MTPVLIGLLAAIVVALAVVGVVAYPHLRAGSPLLTPEGERLAREARQRAQDLVGSAAEAITNRDRSGEDGSSHPAVPGPAPQVAEARVVWASPPPRPAPAPGAQPAAAKEPGGPGHPPAG